MQRQQCVCKFGISPACPAHKKKRARKTTVTELISAEAQPMNAGTFTALLHKIVHGSDENCAYGGLGCPIRRDLRIEVTKFCSQGSKSNAE